MEKSQSERIMEIMKKEGILRPRDLKLYGISNTELARMHNQGLVKRVGRGLYVLPEAKLTEHHTLATAGKRVPHGVICLLSALQFHHLTTQAPFEVWLAIDKTVRYPKVDYPPLRIVRFSGSALKEGVEEHQIEGVTVNIYSVAKTVADCFKYRNKIGLDVAIEALRECRRGQVCSHDDLWFYAKICRVANVMRPYLEAIG